MSPRPHVVVVGDTLLDRDIDGRVERACPDSPAPVVDVTRVTSGPGGAGLAALLCTGPADVTLITPLGEDADGLEVRTHLEDAGVRVLALGHDGATRTKSRLRASGESIARIDAGGPGCPVGDLPPDAVTAIRTADVVLVSCYGGGTTQHRGIRAELARRAARRPVVWDPHPRGPDPVPGCALVTPNLDEASRRARMPVPSGEAVARELVRRWSADAVAVTVGRDGAWLARATNEPLLVPAVPVYGDPCGAGDCFAAAAAVALAGGRTTTEAVTEAVASAGAFVARGGTSGFRAAQADDREPMAVGQRPLDTLATLRRGGVVVATGGCFDVLHAGHVSMLEAARALGDALVVLLNSDESVARLKGPGRPVHTQDDRARVLRALSCVDAVLTFEEDDPCQALRSLRPDVWVKGGDYEDCDLVEAPLVRSWGGRVVLLPHLPGRSTTDILQTTLAGEVR
ncbi:MAG TPA: PfkB family carbohydrate kinase [Ornithinibacter sp.]|nr:PfkB family carbohydrate kinase [Ornithinibacter sp.]